MIYDVAIIGGGIAGLALSIDLRRRGHSVILIEKGSYPRSKVCGEYVSNESREYLFNLCPQLNNYKLPSVSSFLLSSTGRRTSTIPLKCGGFGISRFLLEEELYNSAYAAGVRFLLNTKFYSVNKSATELYILNTSGGHVNSKLVCNATGRYYNGSRATKSKYVAIKYHVKTTRDSTLIEIHNFPGGYCGFSDVEESKSCLCYIVNAELLRKAGNDIKKMEENYLFKNSQIKDIFKNSKFVFGPPATVSGIYFGVKKPVHNGILFLGDSAGTIAPITGNGMSIGLRSASALASFMHQHLEGNMISVDLNDLYSDWWEKEFSHRIRLSRYFQKLSEFTPLTKTAIAAFNLFPSLASYIVKQTHGKPF